MQLCVYCTFEWCSRVERERAVWGGIRYIPQAFPSVAKTMPKTAVYHFATVLNLFFFFNGIFFIIETFLPHQHRAYKLRSKFKWRMFGKKWELGVQQKVVGCGLGRRLIHISTRNEKSQEANGGESQLPLLLIILQI